ncbi:MAG: VCBS repeat-containing protein, partial [Actinobacteria bacterium]|nr:VCBS repeat-containing protein [Actinomycetota bacterium]
SAGTTSFASGIADNGIAVSGDFFGSGRELAIHRVGPGWDLADPGERLSGEWETMRIDSRGLSSEDAIVPFDHDGDGRAELLRYYRRDDRQLYLQLIRLRRTGPSSAEAQFISELFQPCLEAGRNQSVSVVPGLADVDGDGLTDLVHGCITETFHGGERPPIVTRAWWVKRRDGAGGPTSFLPGQAIASTAATSASFIDVNGDGRTDVVLGDRAYGLLRGAGGFTLLDQHTPDEGSLLADFNGDGLDDVFLVRGSGTIRVRLSTGHELAAPVVVASEWELPPNEHGCGRSYAELVSSDFRVVDLDGDGRQDLIAYQDTVSRDESGTFLFAGDAGYRDDGSCPRTIIYRNRGTSFEAELPTTRVPGLGGRLEDRYLRPSQGAFYVRDPQGPLRCSNDLTPSSTPPPPSPPSSPHDPPPLPPPSRDPDDS